MSTSEDASDDHNHFVGAPYLPDGKTPDQTYNITVNLSTGVPITELKSKSHEINVVKNTETSALITLSNPENYAGNRDFILKYRLTGDEIQSGLLLSKGNDENYFMLTVQPPEHFEPEDIARREYIFVLDVSGSMNGYPLDTAKVLIRDLVSNLREEDSFNLILFSGSSVQMSKKSVSATEENIKKALHLIDKQEGYGGTSLTHALEDAIAIPSKHNIARSIVVITDGYVSGEQNAFDVINDNMDNANFFSFGIGNAVNEYLIKGIATAGLGESFIVTDAEDAIATADRFRTYIQSPLLTDIQITYDGFDVYDVDPSVPSTLFAQKPIVLFGKWKGEPKGTITITGKKGKEDYIYVIAPSCSGVRFLITLIAMLIFSFVHRAKKGFLWTVLSLPASYVLTVLINVLRIILSIYVPLFLGQTGFYSSSLTQDTLHSAIGTATYFASLLVIYHLTDAYFVKPSGKQKKSRNLQYLVPAFWYFMIVLGIPYLNHASTKSGEKFTAYAALISFVCLPILLLFCLTGTIRKHAKALLP